MLRHEFLQLHSIQKRQAFLVRKRARILLRRLRKNRNTLRSAVLIILLSSLFGFGAGLTASGVAKGDILSSLENSLKLGFPQQIQERIIETTTVVEREYIPQTTEEEKIIDVVRKASLSVVSIVVTKEVPVYERVLGESFELQLRQIGTERQEIGGGTGFIVSEEGLLLTNKHVVRDEDASYTVYTTDGHSYVASVLARDPFQDLAVLKIERKSIVDANGNFVQEKFMPLRLGNSDHIQIGQTAIVIGNALGEFRNTVSVGVISGLGRTITASGGGFVETIEDVIQTDAAINRGNSGGPLLNLVGEVIGINTATITQAQSIGFSIPVNRAKRNIEQVQQTGKITYPFLGVRYIAVQKEVQERFNLPVDYGALVRRGESGEAAVSPGSAAAQAGLRENDLILEINGERITQSRTLAKIIQERNPGESVVMKILRNGEERILTVVLGEMSG
ncbi:MAG: trypsin-like peptidase domain-containing protein [Candidatus Yanofskybacteria bacterium]|nr:trypsin-like peptidase domain-containing protein [Candidatus Yanofskybacteria bacterium]